MRQGKNPLILGLGILALSGMLLTACVSPNPAYQPAPTAPADAGDEGEEEDEDGVG